ncbi:hypothetical protein CRE_26891 [Caenorhabditis remanei]|uniref:Autophagy-related protein 6 n=1 Tax=Caenorhabditis remanei TaxID=31234 RepID=E3NS01_CAERE|nr:hypothetical protein CRE_26891 [Caenorhabditis remanei]
MEQRSYICLNCQNPLRLEFAQRRPDSADSEKKSETVITEALTGHSRNLMKLISDAQFPSDAPVCNVSFTFLKTICFFIPIFQDCSDALVKEMDAQVTTLDDEVKTYQTYITYLKENHPTTAIPELKAKLQNVADEERDLELQLKKLLCEEEAIDTELQTKRRAAEASSETSTELWKKYRDNLRQVFDDQDELHSLESERQYAEVQHRKLIDTNVLDLCFHIWVDGIVGEINGFRLGYLKEAPVEFTEINAALGQIVLLLEILLERIGVQHHELVPVAMGSHSYIKLRRNGNDIENYALYGQGTPLSGSSGIDAGIRRFLQLLEFLLKELKDRNKNFKPPYQIHAESLVDNGVKYNAVMTLNTDVRWSRAMALMLTDMKAACAQCDALRAPI